MVAAAGVSGGRERVNGDGAESRMSKSAENDEVWEARPRADRTKVDRGDRG